MTYAQAVAILWLLVIQLGLSIVLIVVVLIAISAYFKPSSRPPIHSSRAPLR